MTSSFVLCLCSCARCVFPLCLVLACAGTWTRCVRAGSIKKKVMVVCRGDDVGREIKIRRRGTIGRRNADPSPQLNWSPQC